MVTPTGLTAESAQLSRHNTNWRPITLSTIVQLKSPNSGTANIQLRSPNSRTTNVQLTEKRAFRQRFRLISATRACPSTKHTIAQRHRAYVINFGAEGLDATGAVCRRSAEIQTRSNASIHAHRQCKHTHKSTRRETGVSGCGLGNPATTIYFGDQFVASEIRHRRRVTAVFVNNQHDIKRRGQDFDTKFVFKRVHSE